ncbi:hypothetical protein NUM3379_05320 [Kineococcus sp. NUM-3379]
MPAERTPPADGPPGPDRLTARLGACRPPDVTVPWLPEGPDAEREVRRWLQEGLVQSVLGRVVVAAGVELDRSRRAAALCALVPPGAVVVGASAAWLHTGGPAALPVDVALARTAARTAQRHATAGTAPLSVSSSVPPARDVVHVAGLAVTTPARTAVDLARTAAPGTVPQALVALLRLGPGAADLGAQLADMAGVRNVRHARQVLAAAGAPLSCAPAPP